MNLGNLDLSAAGARDLLQALLDSSGRAELLVDAGGRVLLASAGARACLEAEDDEHETLGPEAREVITRILEAQAAGEPLVAPDLSWRSRSWRVQPLTGSGEGVVRLRLLEGEAARLSREELVALVAQAEVGVSVVRLLDPDDPESLRIEYANPAAEVASRGPVRQLVGQRFLDAFPGIRDTAFPALYQQVVRDGVQIELPEIRYGDETVPEAVYSVTLRPLPGGAVLGQYANVTAARLVEGQLRRLFERAPVALVVVDTEPVLEADDDAPDLPSRLARCQVVDANVLARERVGWEAGDPLTVGELLPGLDADLARRVARSMRRGTYDSAPVEALVEVRAGGELFPAWLNVDLSSVEERKAALGLTDVSELEEVRRELERSNRDLAGVAHTISHDLQAPLQAVRNLLELTRARSEEARQTGYLDRALEAVARMDARMRDVLDYAQVGRSEVETTRVDTGALVQRALEDLAVELARTEARVEVGALPPVQADEVVLVRVFQNLVANALKYTGAAPPHIAIRARRVEGGVRFEVRDQGIGMAPGEAERAFLPFERLAPEAAEGTGLGLAVVKARIERLGGRVGVESELGVGSTFWFELPDEPQEAEAPPRARR